MRGEWLSLFFLGWLVLGTANAEEPPGLPVGSKAPLFEAASGRGDRVRLQDELERGPVVLVFYRGGWCPYCNRQLHALQERIEEFRRRGTLIIAVSVDRPQKAREMVEAGRLDFPVIPDPSADLLEKYNAVMFVPEDLARMYKEKYGIDLEAASGRRDHLIAVPATYVIAPDGKIVFAHSDRDYKNRPSVDDVLAAVDEAIPKP